MDLHHKPVGSHSLAPRPGSLARLTLRFGQWSMVGGPLFRPTVFRIPISCAAFEIGPRGKDSHLQPSRFERDASADWATRGVVECWRKFPVLLIH